MESVPLPPARHTCYCGRSYGRKEHLTRHQHAVHEGLGYNCDICQRHFKRSDLLRQHSVVHDPNHARAVVSCDSCRAKKTKCSGGPLCLLCERRGIECTFLRVQRRTRYAPIDPTSTAVVASARENDSHADRGDSTPDTVSGPIRISDERSLCLHPGQPLPPDVDLFLNLKVLPSPPMRASEFQPSSNGIKAIYEILIAEGSSLESSVLQWTDSQERLEKYRGTYFQKFHSKWPILHAPTFGIHSSPLQLAASVCVLGSWFMNPTGDERSYTLKVHDILLQRLLTSLMNQELIAEGQGWPSEHFQAVLLTLIFSLYRTDAASLSKATHLRHYFITTLRDLGAFNGRSLGAHLETYYSGSYAPYALSMRERFKRLSALTYQFDTYFALARKIPSLMHHHEISIPLPCTFMLWNTYGLDLFPIRQREEPPERSLIAVSTMISYRNSSTPLQFLVEDVQLGLCGLLQAIWVFTHPFATKTEADYGNAAQRAMLTKKLDTWKHELDTINGFANSKNFQSDNARYLYLAYRGENNFIAPSLERMSGLIHDTMILYYFMRLMHYAGLSAPPETSELGPVENSNLDSSQTMQDDREALVCALQLLAVAETNGTSSQLPSVNPLTYHALGLGMHVVQVVLSKQVCDCLASDGEQQATTNDLRLWAENGGRVPWINDFPICVCTFERCTERFQSAIRDRKPLFE